MAQVTFVGACGTVTGSSTRLDFGAHRLLVDCGMFQGDDELEARNWSAFPFDPAAIGAVLLTHAHLDHTGLLPKLVAAGFRGPIYCSRATRPLARLVLEDAAELQEEEARFAAKKGYSRHARPRPLFDRRDAERAIELLEPVRFHDPFEVFPGVTARLLRAGHLLGAASLEVAAKDGTGARRRWLFSGDVGRYGVPILVDPEAPEEAPDALLLESTYGDRGHDSADAVEELAAVIDRAFARGGFVLVPAFALGRTQDLLYHLSTLVDSGRLDPDRVFLDSPMAIRATEIYRQATPEFDEEMRERIANGDNPLAIDRFRRARSVDESKSLNERSEPAVVVAASGMATGGRIVHHLARRLPDPRTAVVFVGYQAAGTRGRALLDGAQAASIHGRRVEVRAEIVQIGSLSAHADAGELVRWCRALPAPPRRIFLNHGEDPARKALAATLVELGWPRPELPRPGSVAPW
ncbi:MAG: beta-lactamase domain protein [Acidobacteria bacterium]|nr:beta-lactamase domain protein [Acidobacteriota bacterium]